MRNGFVCVYCPRPDFCDAALQSEWKSIQSKYYEGYMELVLNLY